MKIIAISFGLLLVLRAAPSYAQHDTIRVTGDSGITFRDFKPSLDSVFAPLNKTAISSGLLINRIIPFSHLAAFAGAGAADSEVNWKVWSSIQVDLFNASYSPTARRAGR